MPIEVFVAFIGVVSLATAIVCIFVLRLTLARRLKKHLAASGAYWNSGTLDFGLLNTLIFALACTLPFVPKSENYQAIYRDLDVKAFAKNFEIIVAYAMLAGYSLFFVSIPFYFVLKP